LIAQILRNKQISSYLDTLPVQQRAETVGRWRRIWRRLLVLGGTSEGNFVTPYMAGIDAFEAMWQAIREVSDCGSSVTAQAWR